MEDETAWSDKDGEKMEPPTLDEANPYDLTG